jgi:hypothetical protein
MIRHFISVLAFAIAFGSPCAFATWSLDSDSSELTFVSTKAVDIAEVHRFAELSGRISDRGKAVVTVTMSSVKTGIDIRDERMRDILFETNKYPYATIRTEIESDLIEDLGIGESARLDVQLDIEIHGGVMPLDSSVIVLRLNEDTLTVASAAPVVINAKEYELAEGIESLRELANLPSIGKAVPVSFFLTFTQ